MASILLAEFFYQIGFGLMENQNSFVILNPGTDKVRIIKGRNTHAIDMIGVYSGISGIGRFEHNIASIL
jgi:hypothetical protein